MKKFRKCLKAATAVICSFTLTGLFSACGEKSSEYTSFAMGSVLSVKIMSDEEDVCEEIYSAVLNAVNETDSALSATKDMSDVKKLNETGYVQDCELLVDILQDTVMLCNTLERKVDVTLGQVTELWGFTGENPCVPTEDELKAALETVDIEQILIDPDNNTVTLDKGAHLDLGAFGKGAACDTAFEQVKNSRESFIVTLGGTVFAFSNGPKDGKWSVGIRNPFENQNSYFAVAYLEPLYPKDAVFVSTSGSYEKSFTENGKTYHHILDPKTGYPVETDLVSVSVVASSGLNADALSTFCFVNGLNDDTLSTLNSFSAEAIFVFADKTYYVTDGLKNSVEITDSTFTPHSYES